MKRKPISVGPVNNSPPPTPRDHLLLHKGARWLTAVFALLLAGAVQAIPITIIDDGGPDDEPGQKDLNQLTVDFDPTGAGALDLRVTWNWDVITVTGANTGDACALFDTDNDGSANNSLCVIWNNGTSYQTMRLYSCGDTRADRCSTPRPLRAQDNNFDGDIADAGENLVGGPYGSTCSLTVVADTFGTRSGAQASTVSDTQASCNIKLTDFSATDAFLLNVCSYPSQVPGSDPADCVITPDSGFLTLVKLATPDGPTTFTFNLGAGQAANNGDTSFSIDGSGTESLIGFAAGTTYDLSEVVPTGWQLDSAACELSTGTATGLFSGNTVTDFAIQKGRETTCTFTNSKLSFLTLKKVVTNNNGGAAQSSDWTLMADGSGANDFSGTGPMVSSSVTADTFTLSESGPGDYTASAWSCTGGTLNGAQLTLVAGDDVTCTITNDDDAPKLTLAKDVNNDNGGTAVAGDWTLTAATYNPSNPQTGTYALSESGPSNYTQTSLMCDNAIGQVTSVTLGLGEEVICTFVNDDDAPNLTLVKDVINNNGGTAVAGDWTLTAAGYDFATPKTGTYDLSESGPAGYSLTSLTCDNATGQVSSATLGLGENVTCTFVNNDDAPSLTLVKTVNNDNGGTAGSGEWILIAAGYDRLNPQAGTYDLSETGPIGYSLTSLTCNNAVGQVTSVTLVLGASVICTFVNDDDAPNLTLVKQVTNDNGGTGVAGNWTLTATGYNATSTQAGTYPLSETGLSGYSLTSLTCDNAVGQVTSVTLALGESVTCTFVNDDNAPSLTLIKNLVNGANPGGTAVATNWTLTATGPTGFSGATGVTGGASFDAGSYDLSETGPAGYLASDWVCVGGSQSDTDTIKLGLGEDATCTITNTAMGMVELLKLTNGVESNMAWNFTLHGPNGSLSDSSPPTTVDFGGAKLIPGEEYTLCETGIPAGWTLEWQVDTNGDGVPDTILQQVFAVNDDPVGPTGYSRVYDPNYVAPPETYTNDTRCVNFEVDIGETLAFQIDNQFPGGEPRTIGYWKNWNTCTGGNQQYNAANNGGAADGWFILDDLLNNPGYTLGILPLDDSSCEDAVSILDKRDIGDGKKKASDAAYNLASQLLAAMLNLSAGAETCPQAVNAVSAGQNLLASIGFDGKGDYLKGGKNAAAQRAEANALASKLDEYNNGNLCI